MASTKEDENLQEVSGRRTRSGRKVAAVVTSTRSRRSSKKINLDQLNEQEEREFYQTGAESFAESKREKRNISTNIIHMIPQELEDNDGHIVDSVIYEEHQIDSEEAEEDDVVYSHEVVTEDDGEMYIVNSDDPDQNNMEVPIVSDSAVDEKSSSFPFGTVGHSETSEEAQNEGASEEIMETSAVENSLLASLVGDNANSLPSVGGSEEVDGKKDDYHTKVLDGIEPNCEKMDSDDSLSEPALAEDMTGATDGSEATIVNTELVSEDELPLPEKPEINDAEEVSDDELPAPKRAELPADAEIISEDELPSAAANEKRLSQYSLKKDGTLESNKNKRKATVSENNMEKNKVETKEMESSNEQYNPMSPTTESNDAPPVEKKAKTDDSEVNKKKDKEVEKENDKEKDKEKEKEKDQEKEKEKERKKLPDLEKYWRTVKEDSADFTGWTYLLQYVDNESDAEAAREAYDAFLSHYPYCYGYWRKYADYEKRKGIKANCNTVFERGLESIPLSVDLWIHYLSHVKSNNTDDDNYIRTQFERAINACGLEFRSDKLWDAYIKWETDNKCYQNVVCIYDRLLAIPTQAYSGHFDNFQDLINLHSVTSTITSDELKNIRKEVREGLSRSKSKNRRSSSSHHKDENNTDCESKSPSIKDTDIYDEIHNEDNNEIIKQFDGDISDFDTLVDDEISSIKDKIISSRRKIHKNTVAAVTARWTFEEGIKRPYFHVKPLERCQLKNWKDYLDFEIEKGDRTRILVLFERCLIACALYDEFWIKMVRYLETQLDQPNISSIISDVFRRACRIHHPDKPSLHLLWAAFEECQNNFDGAAEVLTSLEKKCPNLLQVAYRRINVERRRGDLIKCRELYEHYINATKNKTVAGSLAIKYARFLNKICNDLDGGLRILRQALEKDVSNTRVALQMIDLALQRPKVDEEEVVSIMDKFMSRESIDPEQKVLFAQRKVEFLEDFGSNAKGLQDAQRSLQLALNKANELKKKRESSPSRKQPTTPKESTTTSNSTTQSAYNNGSSSSANANYNYNSTNSAYYNQQGNSSYQQQSYDGYYNQWQYNSTNYSNYGQWSGYGNYY